MSLQNVVEAMGRVLSELPGVDQVLTAPPAKLAEDRMFIVYPDPGELTMMANAGRLRNAVYQADDDIIVQFHMKAARDAMEEMEPIGRAMLEATRDAIVSAIQRNALDGTVVGFRGISTQIYGDLSFWLPDTTCGFQLAVHIRHGVEVKAGSPS